MHIEEAFHRFLVDIKRELPTDASRGLLLAWRDAEGDIYLAIAGNEGDHTELVLGVLQKLNVQVISTEVMELAARFN